jgi:ATP-dependent RNA helicase RhlE
MAVFSDFKLSPNLLKALVDMGFTETTPIQELLIPKAMSGADVIGVAQTGTGKTAAYLLPILHKLRCAKAEYPVRALILVPTKELVLQVEQQVLALIAYTDLRLVALYGGVGAKIQIANLAKGADIVVSTPGRLLEMHQLKAINVRKVETLVLDEADRMLDMGFRGQLYDILEILPNKKRQNFLLSATFPEKVEKVTDDFLAFPIKIEVAPQASASDNVAQFAYKLPNFLSKVYYLERLLLDKEVFHKVIIFTRNKTTADNLFKFLDRKSDRQVRVLHANKAQNTRINSLEDFRQGKADILVCTDVAARGIDIPKVSHVINFEVPLDYLEYVHRIGRTGRAFDFGISITFANKAEVLHLAKIEEMMRKKIAYLSLDADFEGQPTLKPEIIEIEREIDQIKRKENPDFKGAFHKKKQKFTNNPKKK